MVIHHPDQAEYRSVLPEEIDWKPFPAFPPSARLAIVVGDPSEPGPYVIRVKLRSNRRSCRCRDQPLPRTVVNTVTWPAMSLRVHAALGSEFDEGAAGRDQ